MLLNGYSLLYYIISRITLFTLNLPLIGPNYTISCTLSPDDILN